MKEDVIVEGQLALCEGMGMANATVFSFNQQIFLYGKQASAIEVSHFYRGH